AVSDAARHHVRDRRPEPAGAAGAATLRQAGRRRRDAGRRRAAGRGPVRPAARNAFAAGAVALLAAARAPMTLSLLQSLWVLSVPAALGWLLLRVIGLRPRGDPLGFPAWSWPAGCLALGCALFLCLLLHVGPSWWWTAPVVLALLLSARLWRGRLRAVAPAAAPTRRCSVLFAAVVALGAVWCLLQ